MINTYEEALEFMAKYGNVSSRIEESDKTKPSEQDLNTASSYAFLLHKQSMEDCEDAVALIKYHWLELGKEE